MIFLLTNWRTIALLTVIISTFVLGWHSNTIWQAYHAQKAELKEITNLGKGQMEIVKVNQELRNDTALKKDSCATQRIPASSLRVLK